MNIDGAVEWYKDNLNAVIDYSDSTWAMMDVCGSKVALVLNDMHPPHIAFSLAEDTCFGDKSEVKQHRDGSHYVYLNDPFGNTIEIIKYNDPRD
mgnify:CR=1 FL=1